MSFFIFLFSIFAIALNHSINTILIKKFTYFCIQTMLCHPAINDSENVIWCHISGHANMPSLLIFIIGSAHKFWSITSLVEWNTPGLSFVPVIQKLLIILRCIANCCSVKHRFSTNPDFVSDSYRIWYDQMDCILRHGWTKVTRVP